MPRTSPVSPERRAEMDRDKELVRRFVREGDEQAFTEIYRLYRQKIYLFANNILRSPQDAEEIADDVFVNAYRCFRTFRGDCAVLTWLVKITFNLSRNRYRSVWKRMQRMSESLSAEFGENGRTLGDTLVDDGSSQREVIMNEFTDLMKQGMRRLSPLHRTIMNVSLAGKPYEEIAEEWQISVGTVKSRLSRARAHLQVKMMERCPEFSSPQDVRSLLRVA